MAWSRRGMWGLLLVLAGSGARAADCGGAFSECKEDCSLQYGSIRVDMKKRFAKCIKRCQKESSRCTEHVLEARSNNLEEGALDHTPPDGDAADAQDDARPDAKPAERRAGAKKKKAKRPAVEEEPTEPASDEGPPRRREVLSDEEVPASSRTQLKSDEKSPAPPRPSEASPQEAPATAPAPPKAESPAPAERDEPAPAPKREERYRPPPPRKEDDHDDLRNY